MTAQRWHPFAQLILARLREFFREPSTIFWVYAFPLILAIFLGLAFSNPRPEPPQVDVADGPDRARAAAIADQLRQGGLKVDFLPLDECRLRLRRGASALVLVAVPDRIEYVYDVARADSVLARRWAESVLVQPHTPANLRAEDQVVEEPGSRYIDFLLPGLIGMNIMGGGLFGVGFVLVDMRVRKLFKRLMATPMRHSQFLLSLLTARLIFLLPEMFSLLVVARLMFGVPCRGSVLLLVLVIVVGSAAFSGLGLLIGCRTEKTETMSGLINLIMLPTYLLSGIFFSSKRFPDYLQPIVQALPLTHLNNALRAVMLEGEDLGDIALPVGVLLGWAVVTFALALRWFKWR